MMVSVLIVLVLAVAFFASLPVWAHSTRWGYLPSLALGVFLAVMVAIVIYGRL